MQSLSEADRKAILDLTRQAVARAVHSHQLMSPVPSEGVFSERRGLFVTIHVNKKLQGCIGMIEAQAPLGEALAMCAADAALRDPRFREMQPEQLEGSEVEISLLTPLFAIRPEEIQVGKHGLLVQRGVRKGLLLPQVATEHHMTVKQFLQETCVKAGLPREAWEDPGTKIYGFECEIIR